MLGRSGDALGQRAHVRLAVVEPGHGRELLDLARHHKARQVGAQGDGDVALGHALAGVKQPDLLVRLVVERAGVLHAGHLRRGEVDLPELHAVAEVLDLPVL